MIVDLHFHTSGFSSCSYIPLDKGVRLAKDRGIDAVCLTEHDKFAVYPEIPLLEKRYNLKIFIGVEILTIQGDLLCFGLDTLPDTKPRAEDLTAYIDRLGGASIAAHPFRANGRGMGDLFLSLPGLSAVEGFNGNTADEANLRAVRLAEEAGIAITGGSDAHRTDRIGCFATEFPEPVRNTGELAAALRSGDFRPVKGRLGYFQSCL